MEYRTFGNTNLVTSAVGFGLWPIGGVVTHGYDRSASASTGNEGSFRQEAIAAIRRALDLGVTLFDTAPAYGNGFGEEILAEALGSYRQQVVIVTKCGVPWNEEKQTWLPDSSYEEITRSAEDSLRALNTDYIDLLLIHWPDPATPFEVPMRALNDLLQAGKVRHVGVSNFNRDQIVECERYGSLAAQQIGYNLFDRRMEPEMLPFCQARGIGVMAYGPLAHGLLTGAFTPETRLDSKDWRARGDLFGLPLMTADNLGRNVAVVERLKRVAAEAGCAVAQLAVAWVLRHPAVTVALTGARRPGEIEENALAADWRLSESELEQIDAIMADAAGTAPDSATKEA